MLTDRVKALFYFIEYLHSNIEEYKTFLPKIKEYYELGNKKRGKDPRKSFIELREHEKLKVEENNLGNYLKDNLIKPICDKGVELGIFNNAQFGIESIELEHEIEGLKTIVSENIVSEIKHYSRKYKVLFEERKLYQLMLSPYLLDYENSLKSLFCFFDPSLKDVFYITTKRMTPSPPSDRKNRITSAIAQTIFFKGLTPENWEQHEETFFAQRMATYKESYTLAEKLKLELLRLENLSINKTDYQILKDRYRVFLEQKHTLPPQQTEKPKPKLKDFFIKDYSTDVIAEIQTKFKKLEGKDLAILIYLLHRKYKIIEILTHSRTMGRKGFVKCLKETSNPTMQKVNKCFVPSTDDLIYSKDDLVFQSLDKKLTETINN